MTLAVLCPGQGGQNAQMLDLCWDDPRARPILTMGEKVLGADIHQLLQGDFFQNALAQPLVCLTMMATWACLKELLPTPKVFAGYSVGELAAYGCADSLTPERVVQLAQARARLMDDAYPEPNGLVAVRGLERQKIRDLCHSSETFLAIANGFDRFVVGGLLRNLDRVEREAQALGAHLTALPIAIASHTPLMASARRPFAQALQNGPWGRPVAPVLAGITGAAVRRTEGAQQVLVDQLDHPLEWSQCLAVLPEMGCNKILELGPGRALTIMVQEQLPTLEARSVADFRSWQGVVDWVSH